MEMKRQDSQAGATPRERDALVAALTERVKELDCLYEITRLAQRSDLSLDDILAGACEVLAKAWQYPGVACARVVLGGLSRATANFRRSADKQASPVKVDGEVVGRVEVGYLEKMPPAGEGPFLREERHLLDAVADHLGRIAQSRRDEERLRELSRELLKAQEHERQRIARELHDDVAQALSATRVSLDGLVPLLGSEADAAAARQVVQDCSGRLGAAVASLRDLAYGLLPPALDQLGLVGTAFRLCEEFAARHGVRVDFTADGMEAVRLPFETSINLYRVLQECLGNACRHGGARRVTVRLIASHPHVLLRVADDGKGFDAASRLPRALAEKRMGVWSMRERMRLLGGRLVLRSRPGKGTTVTAEAPLTEETACPRR
ncbi:sensor histidine kinase [Solidesulfovibrio sp.]|uniref:sensor histidine kinase n=1 Tax=Solidesulfovibrio sp. TaxID=2910990 RepID=UPI00260CE19F|nr:sensor histidine kinase [Solidesulfovibrio sp.]